MEACRTWLEPQLEALRPELIVALGKVAAQNLLLTATPISALRGSFADFKGIPLMPTFHPAYLLRQPNPAGPKRLVWEDMKRVMSHLGLEAPPR
jgi:DNA polymerase